MNKNPTVAVVTATIGREDLRRAIESVRAQTYPCHHYVFVDGVQYFQTAQEILKDYPEVTATFLPMNTGANGWVNASVNAIAPFLVREDIICYLDDDNWYEPNHIEAGVRALMQSGADWAYSLRHLYDLKGNYLCVDNFESIGLYERGKDRFNMLIDLGEKGEVPYFAELHGKEMIDTNCFFVTKETAKQHAPAWHVRWRNDRSFYQSLKAANARGVCTKAVTVNYLFEVNKSSGGALEEFKNAPLNLTDEEATELGNDILRMLSKQCFDECGGHYPWEL